MITGGFLALLAAATFAMNNAAFRRGALTGTVAQAMTISLSLGVAMFIVAVLLFGAWDHVLAFSPFSVFLLAMTGVLHFGWGRYCNFRATKAMGANLVGPPQQSSLVVTLLLAILLLGEALTPLRILGIVLIVVGPAVSLRSRKATLGPDAEPTRSGFKPNYVEGYTFALLSATGYGASPVMVRHVLEGTGVAASLAAGLIGYLAAALLLSVMLLRPGTRAEVRAVSPVSRRWFAISGSLVALSQMFGYVALAFAPVTVVTPIQRLSLVFRVFANSLLNREHEVLGGRVWFATAVALLGALALTISTETVLAWLPLPGSVQEFARWQWPN